MKYRIEQFYCLYEADDEVVFPVLMYSINGYPFTFDNLSPDDELNPDIIEQAEKYYKTYTAEDLYYASSYLIMEQCHPCFDELDLENPELLPKD